MYVPQHFDETRLDRLHGLIRSHPFATLVVSTSAGLDANHIPFEIDTQPQPYGTLRGHVARANPVWREFKSDAEVLVIFQGPQAYVSPSWYETKRRTGQVVPTWNYVVVHAYGRLRVMDDRAWLRDFVERLTERHEASRPSPWKVSDAPAEYIDKMLGAIVGLEIPLTRLIGKWKLSQNRPGADQNGTVEGLQREGGSAERAVAEWMQRHKNG